jgi:hypothetical protein
MGSLNKANADQWVFLNFLFAKVVNSSLETIFWTPNKIQVFFKSISQSFATKRSSDVDYT